MRNIGLVRRLVATAALLASAGILAVGLVIA